MFKQRLLLFISLLVLIVLSSCSTKESKLKEFEKNILKYHDDIEECLKLEDGSYEYISTNIYNIENIIKEENIYFYGNYKNSNFENFYYSSNKQSYISHNLDASKYTSETIIFDDISFCQESNIYDYKKNKKSRLE